MTDTPKQMVLLVDDDSFLLQMYGMKFKSEGYDVHTSSSAMDAVSILRGGLVPDAIAFDITMPEHDGFFLLETMQSEGLAKNAKKFALTNQQSEEERNKALELGADGYLIKATMIPSEVVNTVRAALSGNTTS
jgi:DNA-binding response OmpR family regulator